MYSYTLQWLANILGAKGAGNPVGFMGSLSDTLNLIYLNKGAGGGGGGGGGGVQWCSSDNTVISSVKGNIQLSWISAKVNYYRLLSWSFYIIWNH